MSPTLMEIERSIRALSIDEQLWLLERIAHQLREKTHTGTQPINLEDMDDSV